VCSSDLPNARAIENRDDEKNAAGHQESGRRHKKTRERFNRETDAEVS